MSGPSCLATPTADPARYTLSAASQLSVPTSASFVKVSGSKLQLDSEEFRIQGPNIYWLGLDENVVPNPSYPSKERVLEIMAVAKVMGATTIRSTSLGVSVGTGSSVENALNTFKANDSAAWDAIDFAVYAARSYGLRLIIPLTDQYDYYHGGIPTFLRWRNLSSTNFDPFYDLSGVVYQDFRAYINNLLTHTSPYTNLTLATDPTVLALETGNELGGWTGKHYPPPVDWTTSISQYLKELAPETLVISGSYGVRKDELGIESIDIHSDHFYPTYRSRLSSSASTAHSANKPFLVGEYDWTNQYYLRFRWGYFLLLLPAVLAIVVWFLPKRWWPWTISPRGLATCQCYRRRRKRRRETNERGEYGHIDSARSIPLDDSNPVDKPGLDQTFSTTYVPILTTLPPARPSQRDRRIIDRPLQIHRWMFSLFLLLLALPLFGIIYTYLPTPISPFLSSLSSLEITSNGPSSIGDLYWSLFGYDDTGCQYVQHHDGYTLHYPTDPTAAAGEEARGSGEGVLRLTKHAWKTRGETPFWINDQEFDIDKLEFEDLPVVAFPQAGLQLENGTIVGGS
ncbi:uncharacterized protein JCM6883_007643 [Sporobolomyces salmoneus]|uniref:uncharacterized protein n=1 Tax=Sporobolomyces salmoneus TaxID=183962 RepID=UPI00316D4736